jgi:hypothetical protein
MHGLLKVRRFKGGDYTLNNDFDPENETAGLDVILTLIGGDAKVS